MTRNSSPLKRIILLGGGETLRKIVVWAKESNIQISVITAPRHSDEVIDKQSLETFLKNSDISYLITKSLNTQEVLDFIGDPSDAFCLSLGAAWIFDKKTIDVTFKRRLFNLHGSRLPQNRGGGGFTWQILMGNRFGFCQLHMVDEGIDNGDIIETQEFLYPHWCRIPEDFREFYVAQNFSFIVEYIKKSFDNGLNLSSNPQSEYLSTYWPRLDTEINGWIDWSLPPNQLERFICAFDRPYKGAASKLNDKKIYIRSVAVDYSDGAFHPFQCGLIFRNSSDWICVAINGATLIIEELSDENGKIALDTIKVGDRFLTPLCNLNEAKQRVVYTPSVKVKM